ncbi:MAG: class I SAM-dependent methyltransferase [Dehalococcoidia bacterium]|nr:class I SAM-dependent methyltransferase [Dehalococcoidia bacterium]
MPAEAERGREYERWLRGGSLSGAAIRWAMSGTGQWLVNTPLLRLPEELRVQPEQRWLDIGCGRAGLLRLVADRVRFVQPPVGVDFSGAALSFARRDLLNNLAQVARRVSLARASATALPFASGSFEVVTAGYVLKHLDDSELVTTLGEVRRVLAPGGLALLWEFAPSGSARLDRWNERWLSPAVRAPRLRSTGALVAAGRAAGFELVRPARLRPFLLPPIPRASVLLGRAPEGWHAGAAPERTDVSRETPAAPTG